MVSLSITSRRLMIDRAKVARLRNDILSVLAHQRQWNPRSANYLIDFVEQYSSDDPQVPFIALDGNTKREIIRHLNKLS